MKIGILLFPFFCLFLSLFVLITDPAFTYLLLEKEAVQPTKQLFKYFAGRAEIPEIFDDTEKAHFGDVKKIIWGSFALLIILTLICCKEWEKIAKKGTLLLLALILLAVMMPFDTLFTIFHQVLFPQGNWMFPADSTIITFYPMSFFITYAIAIAIHAVITAGILLEIVSRKG